MFAHFYKDEAASFLFPLAISLYPWYTVQDLNISGRTPQHVSAAGPVLPATSSPLFLLKNDRHIRSGHPLFRKPNITNFPKLKPARLRQSDQPLARHDQRTPQALRREGLDHDEESLPAHHTLRAHPRRHEHPRRA